MRNLIGGLFAAVVLFAGVAQAKEATTTFKVNGWHCGGCGKRTEAALKAVPGVTDAKADKATNTVTVTFDDEKATSADLEKAIAGLNYKIEK